MCRDFSPEPVPPATIDRLLERARWAPSAGHTQGWAFVVLEGAEQTGRFWTADADAGWLAHPDRPGVLEAPVIVVPWCHPRAYVDRYAQPDKAASGLAGVDAGDWPAPYWLIDTSFATMLILLGAVEEELGALFFRLHGGTDLLRSALGVPEGWEPIGAVALGRPAGSAAGPGSGSGLSARRGRPGRALRAWDEIVHRGGW